MASEGMRVQQRQGSSCATDHGRADTAWYQLALPRGRPAVISHLFAWGIQNERGLWTYTLARSTRTSQERPALWSSRCEPAVRSVSALMV